MSALGWKGGYCSQETPQLYVPPNYTDERVLKVFICINIYVLAYDYIFLVIVIVILIFIVIVIVVVAVVISLTHP